MNDGDIGGEMPIRTETLPVNSVVLTTTARGAVTIEVKISNVDADAAAAKATEIFDKLRAQYAPQNEANAEYYRGKG